MSGKESSWARKHLRSAKIVNSPMKKILSSAGIVAKSLAFKRRSSMPTLEKMGLPHLAIKWLMASLLIPKVTPLFLSEVVFHIP